MPSAKPRASFEPIRPDYDINALIESSAHFQYVDRISCDMIDQQGLDAFDKLVLLHVIKGGKPLIIDGYQKRLDEWTFSSKWLQDNLSEKVENARNLTKKEPLPLTIGHYLRNMGKLSDQYFDKPDNYLDKNRQRIYLKDIDCPQVWSEKLREHLPPSLFYLNESTGDIGGPGSSDEVTPGVAKRRGRGIAPAGDLMSSLPPAMRAENLMCYIGHEGTYTPAHREMCASIGHNIMVETSEVLGTDGVTERPGSSIWFMTETKDRQLVSEYWLSVLGHDIEVESHFAQINAWKKAPFTVYVVEQRAGDFLIIPPLAPHQVWNRGTRTMKVAWNRTTVDTLELALEEALPRARQVCRDEQYKNKAIVFYSLGKYHGLLSKVRDFMRTARTPDEQNKLVKSPKIRNLQKEYKRLFNMFKRIMLSEMFAPEIPNERNVQYIPFDSNITCAYCRGNIFNRFLTCESCDDLLGAPEKEPYDVCMDCYVMGRSCGCISKLRWVEQFKWKELSQRYETWRRLYLELDNGVATEDSPLPLNDERARLGKNTVAQICQNQLRRRPWVNVHSPQEQEELEESEDDQIIIGDDGSVKKKAKKRSESWLKNHRRCHVCKHRHPRWKTAECSCGRFWCYGTLFRGHDLMPHEVMEQPNWRCPHCQGRCSAGICRKDPKQQRYEPNGTLLGHDTRAVADVRSVEVLVDFSVSNQNWLREDPDSQSKRFRKHQQEANQAKLQDPALEADVEEQAEDSHDGDTIDPALGGGSVNPGLKPYERQALQLATNRIDGALDDDQYSDYQPAQQAAFVAPMALMNSHQDGDHEVDDCHSPDPETDETRNALGKRPFEDGDDMIKLAPPKRVRHDRPSISSRSKFLSGASKQYRKDHERRALEEARRKGRYIQTSAALRGKSKIVKLSISPFRLQSLQEKLAGPRIDADLLETDLAPPQESRPNGASGVKNISNKVRIRERDEDYSTRKGARKAIEEDSEIEDLGLDDSDVARTDGALQQTESGDKRRRVSSWQQRRAAEDVADGESEDDDTDEGSHAQPARARESAQAQAAKAPRLSTGTPRNKQGPSSSNTPKVRFDIADDDDDSESSAAGQKTAAAAFAQAARQQLRKPSKATSAIEHDEDESLDSSSASEDGVKPVAASSTNSRSTSRSSITSRASRGKKVKIVSGSRRHTTGPGGEGSTKANGFRAVNTTNSSP